MMDLVNCTADFFESFVHPAVTFLESESMRLLEHAGTPQTPETQLSTLGMYEVLVGVVITPMRPAALRQEDASGLLTTARRVLMHDLVEMRHEHNITLASSMR